MATETITKQPPSHLHNLLDTFYPVLNIAALAIGHALSLVFAVLLIYSITGLGGWILGHCNDHRRRGQHVTSSLLIAFLVMLSILEQAKSPSITLGEILLRNSRICACFAGLSIPIVGLLGIGRVLKNVHRKEMDKALLPFRRSSSSTNGSFRRRNGTSSVLDHSLLRRCSILLALSLSLLVCSLYWTENLGPFKNIITKEDMEKLHRGFSWMISSLAKIFVVLLSLGSLPLGRVLAARIGGMILSNERKMGTLFSFSSPSSSSSLDKDDDGKHGDDDHDNDNEQKSGSTSTNTTKNPVLQFKNHAFWPCCLCMVLQASMGIFVYFHGHRDGNDQQETGAEEEDWRPEAVLLSDDDFYWWTMVRYMVGWLLADLGTVVICGILRVGYVGWRICCCGGLSLLRLAEQGREGEEKREQEEWQEARSKKQEAATPESVREELEGVEGKWVEVSKYNVRPFPYP